MGSGERSKTGMDLARGHPPSGNVNRGKNMSKLTDPKVRYKCDSLCIHYVNRDCITEENEGEGLCDQPDKYREVGDFADALNDAALFK